MQIIRSDNTKFTFVEATETISAHVKRGDLVEKAKYWGQTFDCKYGSATIHGAEIKVLLSKSSGYPLGEAAKDFLGTKEKYIWTEPDPGGNGFIFVVIDKGVTVQETLLEMDGDIDQFLMVPFIGEDKSVKVIFSGEIPKQLAQFFADEGIEILVDERDYLILEKLQPAKSIECVDIEIAIDQIAFQKKAGINKLSLVVIIAGLGLIGFWIFDSSKESVARVFDPYINYRAIMKSPSATAQLSELQSALKISENSNWWNFTDCEVNSGPLVCELTPSIGSRTSDLDNLISRSPSGAKYYLVGSLAHYVVPLSPSPSRRPDAMVNKPETLNILYDRLNSYVEPDELKILDSVNNNGWATQNISVVKRDTGLYALGLIAKATNGLPINFVNAKISKKAFLYSFEVEIQVIGTN